MQSVRLLVKQNAKWECDYFKTRSFTLPSNKFLTYTPVENRPNDYYLSKGVTHINVNAGGSPQEQGLAYNQAATFIFNPSHIKDYAINNLGGKYIQNFTEQEARGSADSYINSKGDSMSIITSGQAEYDDANVYWAPSNTDFGDPRRPPCPQQYDWISQQFALRLRAKGGEYFGEYDGHMGASKLLYQGSGGVTQLRNALAGGQAALDLCKANIASGSGNPFFTREHWRFRGGLINTYFSSENITTAHLAGICVNFELNKKALEFVGAANTRICSFMFLSKREYPGVNFGISEYYRQAVNDGYFETWTFSLHAAQWHTALAYLSYVFCSDIFTWEDTRRFGINPNVIGFDEIRGDGFPVKKFYGGNVPQRAGVDSKYVANRDSAYLDCQHGPGHDATMVGIENYTKMVSWAGQASTWTRHRRTGTSEYCSNNTSYIVDRYEANEPVARLHVNGNRRSLFFYDVTRQAGTFQSYDVDINGGVHTFECEAGIPYFFLIDLETQA